MYAPPLSLMFQGTFAAAREQGKLESKWVLVNLQDDAEFASHQLNRDTWKDETLQEVVRSMCVFWQQPQKSTEGATYFLRYQLGERDLPHIAIVDPRTGRQMWQHTGFIEAAQLVENLVNFSGAHSLESNAPPPRPRAGSSASASRAAGAAANGPPRPRPMSERSEEEQMAVALAASLSESGGGGTGEDYGVLIVGSDSGGSDAEGDGTQSRLADHRRSNGNSSGGGGGESSGGGSSGRTVGAAATADAAAQGEVAGAEGGASSGAAASAGGSSEPWSSWFDDAPLNAEPAEQEPGACRVQFRLDRGSRRVRRFLKTDTVSTLYKFVAAELAAAAAAAAAAAVAAEGSGDGASAGAAGAGAAPPTVRCFTLRTMFPPPRDLRDSAKKTLAEANLANAALIMSWAED
ncbi:unnamed protein product [Phaeothamnion confervicola]